MVQRSGPARVTIDGRETGAIDRGLVVLAAFAATDTETEMAWMARKLISLRIFNDDEGKMNRSLKDLGDSGGPGGSGDSGVPEAGILLVSQFTLYGDCRKGNRPSFIGSAPPEQARRLYERFGGILRAEWPLVGEGEFGASMRVHLVNDGPVTVILDRDAPAAGGSGT